MSHTAADERWMRRALALARRAEGRTRPNPLVGAVLVDPRGELLGEGYHRAAGEPHAEIEALRDAERLGNPVAGATLYVTLEPCNHHGRTGPCTEALLEAGIGRAVIAVRDTHTEAAGGVERLRNAGVAVEVGLLGEEAVELNAGFFASHVLGRPLVTLKWAMTVDGCTSLASGESKWITGVEARQEVHHQRARHDAVLAGIGTVLRDGARLSARGVPVPPAPPRFRVVLDSSLRLAPDAPFLARAEDGSSPLVFCSEAAEEDSARELRAAGATVVRVSADPAGGLSGREVLRQLASRGVQSVYIEGGRTVAGYFLSSGLADRVEAWLAPVLAGGGASHLGSLQVPLPPGTMAEAWRLSRVSLRQVGEDWVATGWLHGRLFGDVEGLPLSEGQIAPKLS